MTISVIIFSIVIGMIPRAMPVLSAAIGETVCESAGILNIGLEGMMLLGAIIGFAVDYYTGSLLLGFLAAGLAGSILSSFHALASIKINADQVVSGTAIWFVGWGLSSVIFGSLFGKLQVPPAITVTPHIFVPYLTNLPLVGPLLFGEDPFFYIVIATLIGVDYFLYHTKPGLNLRSVGENPAVAEIMGVNITLYRLGAVLFGGFMAGFGGAYLALSVVGSFYYGLTAGAGFVAVGLVFFAKWKPFRVLIGCLVFGAVYVLYFTLESVFPSVPYEFFAMWPYIAVLLVIMLVGARARAPDSLSKPYLKEG